MTCWLTLYQDLREPIRNKMLICTVMDINACGFISAADILGETALQSDQSENEDRESDYFADGETSSCGSFELDVGLSDSDDGDGV